MMFGVRIIQLGPIRQLNTIVDAINKLRDTASAHRRIIIIEVMAENLAGWQ